MPRAIDPSMPGGGLPISNNPLIGIGYNVIPQELDLAEFLEGILKSAMETVEEQLFPAIEALTGIDLSALLPLLQLLELDLSSPTAFVQSLVNIIAALPGAIVTLLTSLLEQLTHPDNSDQLSNLLTELIGLLISLPSMLFQLATSLLNSGAGLLGIKSPLNSLNLFNLVPTQLMGQLNFSNIGETFTNLIVDPFFEIVESFTGLDLWNHDDTNSHAVVGGSAQTTADGSTKELLGNLIPVSVGQVLNLSGWTKWSGLSGTGNPIGLGITGYDVNNSAISQATIASHNTSPATTDWLQLSGTYTVPTGVTSLRTRLIVSPSATAGTVWFDDVSATKTQSLFQRLIQGTNPGETMTNDIEHLFGGIITNALALGNKAGLSDFNSLVSTIIGDVQEGFEDIGERLASFLHGGSILDAGQIGTGQIGDQFIPGLSTIQDALVTAVGRLTGSGFDISKVLEVLGGQTFAVVDNSARLAQLELLLTGGVALQDDFERTNNTNIGTNWLHSQTGAGKWICNGHDAVWSASGVGSCDFLEIYNAGAIRSTTDLQRVMMVMSSKATSALGNHAANDLWLRISDDTTSLSNITGIRIRYWANGFIYIDRFVSGASTLLVQVGGLTPPGPGAQPWAEAGTPGQARYFRAGIGTSTLLEITEVGTASGVGGAFRRWGHGGHADSSLVTQERPGGLHIWTGKDVLIA